MPSISETYLPLTQLVNALPTVQPFIYDTFFKPGEKLIDRNKFLLDIELGIHNKVAKPVDSKLTPIPRKRTSYKSREVSPAYFQESVNIAPSELQDRLAGEALGGTLTPDSRLTRLLSEVALSHKKMIENRLELMSCQALLNGGYTLQSDQYARSAITFGRNGSLAPTALTGTDRWWIAGVVGTTANPLKNIQDMINLMFNTNGSKPTDIILGANAAKGFSASAAVREILNNNYRDSRANFNLEPQLRIGLSYLGDLGRAGEHKVWVYSQRYEDDNGVLQEYFDPNRIALVDNASYGGAAMFGLIENMKFLQAAKLFSNVYEMDYGKGLKIVTETAPLVYPTRPDSSAAWTVAA
jgi:hypothetical protein